MKYTATVMIPAFNMERFLPEAIESALNQTYKGDYEVLIINDGSTDSTPRIAESFAKRNSNVRVLHQQNRGIGSTRNRLLDESRGNILFGLDADDRFHPRALEAVIGFYQENQGVGFVYTDQRCIDDEGRVLYEGRKAGCHPFFDSLIYFTQFPGHLRSFRKDLIGDARFDVSLPTAQDWDFLLKINPFVGKGHVPEILCDYRINTEGVSRTTTKKIRRDRSVRLLEKYIRAHNLYPNAQDVEVVVVADGDHAIHYEHVVDGMQTMNPEAKEALINYFSAYKNPIHSN